MTENKDTERMIRICFESHTRLSEMMLNKFQEKTPSLEETEILTAIGAGLLQSLVGIMTKHISQSKKVSAHAAEMQALQLISGMARDIKSGFSEMN